MKRTWVLLCAAIILHGALALPTALLRRDLRHDEAITLLAITGHQGQYDQLVHSDAAPHRVWARARDWQELLAMPVDHPPELSLIARDLGKLDIHPPLYFWLFSLVARIFGVSTTVGLGLNFAFDILTIFATYGLGKRVLRDNDAAALAAMLWAISPGPLEAGVEMRQYSLLGLLVPTFAIFVTKVIDSRLPFRIWDAFAITILCALGILTHYHFLLLVVACAIVVLSPFGRKYLRADQVENVPAGRKKALAFGISSFVGVICGFAAHPHLAEIMERQRSQAQSFDWREVPIRIGGVLVGLGRFFVSSVPLIVVWMIVLVVGIGLVLRAPRGSLIRQWDLFDVPLRRLFMYFIVAFAAQATLFLAFRSPAGAMRAKYLVLDYSLIACVIAAILTRVANSRHVLRVVAGIMFVSSIIASVEEIRLAQKINASLPSVASAPGIVFDTVARGSLPAALWNVPPEMPVFAAAQRDIIERRDQLFPKLEPGTLVVLDTAPSNANGSSVIIGLSSRIHRIEESRPAVFGNRLVLTIRERLVATPRGTSTP